MRRLLLLACLVLGGAAGVSTVTRAQTTPSALPDTRIPIALAAARRDNWRCLMRGHLSALVQVMQHMSAGEYPQAAALAERNFGLVANQPEFCHEPLFSKEASLAAATLAPQPPEAVRAMFRVMRTTAAQFVRAARAVPPGGNPAAAWSALAKLGGQCPACHAAYRLE
jgi:cytochrome c556